MTTFSIAIIAMVDDHHGGGGGSSSTVGESHPSPMEVPINGTAAANKRSLGPSGIRPDLLPFDLVDAADQQLQAPKNNATNSTGAATINSNGGGGGRSLANVFVKSKNSLKTPLISQEKFHWDAVSLFYPALQSSTG